MKRQTIPLRTLARALSTSELSLTCEQLFNIREESVLTSATLLIAVATLPKWFTRGEALAALATASSVIVRAFAAVNLCNRSGHLFSCGGDEIDVFGCFGTCLGSRRHARAHTISSIGNGCRSCGNIDSPFRHNCARSFQPFIGALR